MAQLTIYFKTMMQILSECRNCDATKEATTAISDKTSLSIKHFGGVFSIHVIIMFVSILHTLCIMKRKPETGGVHQENTKKRNDIFNDKNK